MSLIVYLRSLSNDVVVILIFVSTLGGYLASWLWERWVIPRFFFADEMLLVQQIARLGREAEELNRMDTMPLYSKVQRRIVALKRELAEIRRRRYAYTMDVSTMLMSPLWCDKAPRPGRMRSAPPAPSSATAALAARQQQETRQRGQSQARSQNPGLPEGESEPTSTSPGARGRKPWGGTPLPPVRDIPPKNTDSEPPRWLSWLPPALARPVLAGLLYLRYNLPDATKYVLRYGTVLIAWVVWRERGDSVSFPSCTATRIPLTLLSFIPIALNFVIFGPTASIDLVTGGLHQSHPPQQDSQDASAAPHCSLMVWALLCLCFVRYAIRVFS